MTITLDFIKTVEAIAKKGLVPVPTSSEILEICTLARDGLWLRDAPVVVLADEGDSYATADYEAIKSLFGKRVRIVPEIPQPQPGESHATSN